MTTPEKYAIQAALDEMPAIERHDVPQHIIKTWHRRVTAEGCEPVAEPTVEFSTDFLTQREYVRCAGRVIPVTDEAKAAAAARAQEARS